MNIVKHLDGIYEVENFLTNEEIKKVLSSENTNNFVDLWIGTTVQDLTKDSLSLMKEVCERFMLFFDNALSHTEITNIRRIKEGEHMPSHTDTGYEENKGNRVFGIVIYLNDDFTGGELNYPNINMNIKPKIGSLVIHKADILHKVLPVISGNRYCLTSFIFGDDSTKINI